VFLNSIGYFTHYSPLHLHLDFCRSQVIPLAGSQTRRRSALWRRLLLEFAVELPAQEEGVDESCTRVDEAANAL
jgi:hypothetical protein